MADPVTPDAAPPAKPTKAAQVSALIRQAVAWERANPRKVAVGMLYLSTHSSRLKPVIGFLATMLGLNLGCASVGTLTPAAHASVNRFECEVKALTPLLQASTLDVVTALEDGSVSADEITDLMHTENANAAQALVAFKACRSLVAPPPNPGDKVL